ncbi:MAG: serine hydrolase domain-containing protein [bacterium]|nr:class A beta-lactamase-related serine hydrolase [Gemmatimonadota bacterium]HIL89352.1 class A beta-lactamase-related serine hydrolase [Gemmatimonadota bacterium]
MIGRAFRLRLLVAAIGVLGQSVLVSAQSPSRDEALTAFSRQLRADVAADDVGGIVAGVMVDGDLVWAQAFGWADRDARTPMSTASISRTGSISKSVTAVLMMRLLDEGVIGLDEPIERYLPAFASVKDRRVDAQPVTFRHLASHTAGLIREPQWPVAVVGPIELWDKRIVESLPLTAYDTVPGARYQYSNIGFGTLGLALAKAAGRPFMEMVRTEVLEPLGMTGSEFVVAGAKLEARLAAGYVIGQDGSIDGGQPAREHAGRGYKVPNGGVYSTVADLGRFMGAMSGVPGLRILSEESRQEALSIQTPENPNRGYGLGFSVQIDEQGRKIASHGGSVAGYTAHMAFDPEARIGVVLLRNYGRGSTNLGTATQGLVAQLRSSIR